MFANYRVVTSMLCAAGAVLSTGLAVAAPPASIVGIWSVIGNQTVQTLNIATQATTGTCRAINGTLSNAATTIRGYYCPSTGRIAFARKSTAATTLNIVNQMWVGNVSDVVTGSPLRMAGTFHAVDSAAGAGVLGEYGFQGVK